MIDGGYLTLQKDFGFGLGTGECTHFRTLSKRSRSRIEDSADRRNGSVLKEARKALPPNNEVPPYPLPHTLPRSPMP